MNKPRPNSAKALYKGGGPPATATGPERHLLPQTHEAAAAFHAGSDLGSERLYCRDEMGTARPAPGAAQCIRDSVTGASATEQYREQIVSSHAETSIGNTAVWRARFARPGHGRHQSYSLSFVCSAAFITSTNARTQ